MASSEFAPNMASSESAHLALHRAREDLDAVVVADRLEQMSILGESAEGDRGVLLRAVLAIVRDGKEWRHDREHREHRETLVILGALGEAQGGVARHPGIRALQQLDQGWQPKQYKSFKSRITKLWLGYFNTLQNTLCTTR